MNLWLKWKRLWRKLELTPAVRLANRRIRQLAGKQLRHFVDVRRPNVRYGDWTVSTAGLVEGGIAYSLGVGEDAELDLALIEQFGLEVHAFDPTPRAVAWVNAQPMPDRFHFHPIGIAGYDGTAEFTPSKEMANPSFKVRKNARPAPGQVTCEVRRLPALCRELGHQRIDLLKMDIEGAEYDVIDDLVDSGIEVRQILIEFHHRFRAIGLEPTGRTVDKLRDSGYRTFYISPSGREYSFVLDHLRP
jgi:FkbM family methyltransferase